MAWLRRVLAHTALSRSTTALLEASGGEPRRVRGMTLDPRLQFIEARARERAIPWEDMTVERLRAQTEALADLFGGGRVGGVRAQRIFMPGRSFSVPGRLYLPQVRDNRAAMLVYFHFGGGVVGSLENCDRLCALIAKMAGAPVLSVEYRLAPDHPFPVGLDDATHAYAWAIDNAARYGAPVRRVAVGGDSIGASFAAIIAQEMRGGRTPPWLQLLIYPVTDWVSDTASMSEFADAFPMTAQTVDFFIKNYIPDGVDPADTRLSPGRARDLSGLAPALVYTAGFDMLLDQGESYADRLAEAGVKVLQRARFDALAHGFVSYPSATPAAESALKRIARETAAALKSAH
ncbi:MAG TPA: alpha/beta hydrolase [Caulobacterales bacterium]|nr:alpha/beta hydrolase [Caulobacterales bacterium]